jgi:hypothetical protein
LRNVVKFAWVCIPSGEALAVRGGIALDGVRRGKMNKLTEKQLDKIIEAAFDNPVFAKWFLGKTRVGPLDAERKFSTSANPWGKITARIADPVTGDMHEVTRECETDILVVFEEAISHKRFALHIENKLAGGKFTPLQPDFYRPRAQKWLKDPKYGAYTEFATVLISPQVFYDRFKNECAKFDYFVSHEDIAKHLPAFGE